MHIKLVENKNRYYKVITKGRQLTKRKITVANLGENITEDQQLVGHMNYRPFKQYLPSEPAKNCIKIMTLCVQIRVFTGKEECQTIFDTPGILLTKRF